MPFIAPAIVAAVGITSITGAALATAAINVGISVGLSFAAQKLLAKKATAGGSSGIAAQLRVATDAPREVIFGEVWTGGQLVYWHVHGKGNKQLQMVIALASHACQSIEEIRVDNRAVTWDAGAGVVTEYPGTMTIRFYDGTQSAADAGLVAAPGGRWSSTDIGTGIAYVVVSMTYDAKTFPQGIPGLAFRVRGAKLYDPRFDATAGGAGSQRWATPSTWVYSANPAVVAYNVLRGFSGGLPLPLVGLSAPPQAIRYADYADAANACDEPITLKAGGTEARYRCGMIVSTAADNRSIIETALSAMAGQAVHAGGIYRIQAGIARSPVIAITDDDLNSNEDLVTTPRLPRSEIVNTVTASYAASELNGKLRPLPARSSSSDVAHDGGVRLAVDLDLSSVTSRTQAQRIMEIARKRARRMTRCEMTVRARYSVVEAGDWVTFSSSRRGFVSRVFEASDVRRNADHQIVMSLREVDDGIDDWVSSDEIDDDDVLDLPPGQDGVAAISGLALVGIVISAGSGAERPGLRATWTPPGDPSFVELVIEFRKSGDTVALERRAVDPDAGQYSWLDGVQGGATYEARIRPVIVPDRGSDWSSWVSTASHTAPQIVAVAAMALGIDPELIPDAELDAQSRFELRLATALDTTQGSVNERLALVYAEIARINKVVTESLVWQDEAETFARREELTRVTDDEALARITDELAAVIDDPMTGIAAQAAAREVLEGRVGTAEGNITSTSSAVTALQSTVNHPSTGLATRASSSVVSALSSTVSSQGNAITANASAITALETEVDGNTNSITQILQVEGGKKRFAIIFDSNGKFTGGISLDGTETITSLDIAVSELNVYDPSVSGGAPLPLLQVATVGGVPQMILNGTFITRAIEAGVINANSGSIGHLTSAKITSPNGKLLLDATGDNAFIQITS